MVLKQHRLDRYLTVIKDFSKFPEKSFTKEILFIFKGKPVYIWNIDGNPCMQAKNGLEQYLQIKYTALIASFGYNRKKFKVGLHYFFVDVHNREILDWVKKPRGRLNEGIILFFTLGGTLKLLRHIRKGLADEFYDIFADMINEAVKKGLLKDGKVILKITDNISLAHKAATRVATENLKILHDNYKLSPYQLKVYNEVIRQRPGLWDDTTMEKWITTLNGNVYCEDINIDDYLVEIDGMQHADIQQMLIDRRKDMDIREKKGVGIDRLPTAFLKEKKQVEEQVRRLLKRYDDWKKTQ